jgi:multidrug resistance efflux pump
MKMKKLLLLFLATSFALLCACGNGQSTFWGTIEADEVKVISEVTGKVRSLEVQEGSQVIQGQVLCSVEDINASWRLDQAKAAMDAAKAQLEKAKNGAAEEDLAIARANLEYVQALLKGSQEELKIAQETYDFTAPYDLQVTQAESQLAIAKLNFEDAQKKLDEVQKLGKSLSLIQAEAQLEEARLNFLKSQDLYTSATATPTAPDILQAKAALEAARAQFLAAEAQLKGAEAAEGNPDIQKAQDYYDACKIKLEQAENARDYAKRSSNPAQLDQAEYQVQLAEIELREAERNLKMAQAAGDTSYLDRARAEYSAAQAALDQTQAAYDVLLAKGSDYHIKEAKQAYEAASKALDLTQANYNIALAQADPLELAYLTAKENYNLALKSLENVLKISQFKGEERASLEKARTDVESLEAQQKIAQGNLQKLEKGTRGEDIQALEANLAQTEASYNLALQLLRKTSVQAPVSGVILEKYINLGDTINQGSALFSLADLDHLYLKVYVEEAEIGKVKLNQEVKVKVDAYPDRSFPGKVVYISPKAQFTPKNVQTKEQRTILTFSVKVTIEDPEHLLKIGVPADVIFSNH